MKFIVISGTSRGLGAALKVELQARGHMVAGFASREVDVADAAAVKNWSQITMAAHGPPDILVNNAGTTTAPDPLWAQTGMARLLQVNVLGPFHLIRAFLPAMLERGSGVIVNISSDWGRGADPMVGAYCASKWALEGMTRSLALELPPGLAAVTLDPGTWDTDMLRFTFGEGAADYLPPSLWQGPAADLILSLGPQHNGQALTVQT